MAVKYILACTVLLFPLVCRAGRVKDVGAAMPGADYDYDQKPAVGARDPGPAHDPIQQRAAKMSIKDIFVIPANMTEDEWQKTMFKNFQKQQYNDWQKQEYERWEKHRFFQWQQEEMNKKKEQKLRELGEHQRIFEINAQKDVQGFHQVHAPEQRHALMQQFHFKKAAQDKFLQEEHQRFLQEQEHHMQNQQMFHHGWLQELLRSSGQAVLDQEKDADEL